MELGPCSYFCRTAATSSRPLLPGLDRFVSSETSALRVRHGATLRVARVVVSLRENQARVVRVKPITLVLMEAIIASEFLDHAVFKKKAARFTLTSRRTQAHD